MWAMNANTLAVSTWDCTGQPVSDGSNLYLLDTESLDVFGSNIASLVVTTGMLTLGADEKKYISDIKVTLAGDSTTNVTISLELDGYTWTLGPYEMVDRQGAASFTRKWTFAKGVNADSIKLSFAASGGTSWKLQGLVVDAELI